MGVSAAAKAALFCWLDFVRALERTDFSAKPYGVIIICVWLIPLKPVLRVEKSLS